MEEETKYDFSSYLLDKSKGFGRQNTQKGNSGKTGKTKIGFELPVRATPWPIYWVTCSALL